MTIRTAFLNQPSTTSIRVAVITDTAQTVGYTVSPGGTSGNIEVGSSLWAQVELDNLLPATSYTVSLDDGTTLTGSTLSTVRSDFKVLSGSCQKNGSNHAVWLSMRDEAADFLVHQGDLHYRDASDEATWRDGMSSALSASNMREMLGNTPIFYDYDNHDWGGNESWGGSPWLDFIPGAYRELFGDQVDPVACYRTWSHKGVRFIETDRWSQRNNETDEDGPNKYMYSPTQEQWLYDTFTAAQEPLIIFFTGFPLYGNWVGNSRWGDYKVQGQRIWEFFRTHPSIADRTIGIGGDSHNVLADSGVNTMWGIPSLNASPFDRVGDPIGDGITWGGTWDIANLLRDADAGYYSRLSFDWSDTSVNFTWEAVYYADGSIKASYEKSFPIPQPQAGLTVYREGKEQDAYLSAYVGGREYPASSSV